MTTRPAPRVPDGSTCAALPAPPEGTVLLTISRVHLGTHQRGGRREHVARVAPTELRAVLSAQAPGRYRVASIDGGGCFLLGGSFVVELTAGSSDAARVTARTPADYPRRPPSGAQAAKRRTERIEQRVEALQADLREARATRARLERDAAVEKERRLKESVQVHDFVDKLHAQVTRLMDRVQELEARHDDALRKGRSSLLSVREELALERRLREADVARLTASAAVATTPSPSVELPEPRLERDASPSSGPVDVVPPPIAATTPSVPTSTGANTPTTFGPGVPTGVRIAPRRASKTSESSAAPLVARNPSLSEELGRFFRQRHRRPK